MVSGQDTGGQESGAERLLNAVSDYVKAPSWAPSRRVLDAHPELLSDAGEDLLGLMSDDASAAEQLYTRSGGEPAVRLLHTRIGGYLAAAARSVSIRPSRRTPAITCTWPPRRSLLPDQCRLAPSPPPLQLRMEDISLLCRMALAYAGTEPSGSE
jgi:hypothetical protein